MKLVASLIVRNEVGRYLQPCIDHLLEFCDQIVIVDDDSDDGTWEWLMVDSNGRITLVGSASPGFYRHEGRARQALIDDTIAQNPTHVLSLDADEFVSDGAALRRAIEANPNTPALTLEITEVWRADAERLWVRTDGGWRTHPLVCLWRVQPGVKYQMLDKALACRRVPRQVLELGNIPRSPADLLHFGWTDPSTRDARYQRYVTHDGGRFHASSHLKSIMWPEHRMRLEQRPWPEGEHFEAIRAKLVGPMT